MSTAVKAARHARGWTLRHTIAQLRAAAAQIGERLPHNESVRQRLCSYESGRSQPGPFYRELLCTVYDTTPAALGWDTVRTGDPVAYHHGRGPLWTETPDVDAVTALLYALPLATARIAHAGRTRLWVYLRLVTDQPRCPETHVLAAGLRRARAHRPAWLDSARLTVCEQVAVTLIGEGSGVRDPAVDRVPDWLTGARLAAASTTAGVFTDDPAGITGHGGEHAGEHPHSPTTTPGTAPPPHPAPAAAPIDRAGLQKG